MACILDVLLPEREGPFLVPAQAVAVDGSGAGHSVQVVGAVGEGGHPLAVPLGFLLPVRKEDGEHIKHMNQTLFYKLIHHFTVVLLYATHSEVSDSLCYCVL